VSVLILLFEVSAKASLYLVYGGGNGGVWDEGEMFVDGSAEGLGRGPHRVSWRAIPELGKRLADAKAQGGIDVDGAG
jgi:hypothetical protein